jgi:hypothetical protein
VIPNTVWVFIFVPAIERNKIIAVHDAAPNKYHSNHATGWPHKKIKKEMIAEPNTVSLRVSLSRIPCIISAAYTNPKTAK